MQTATDVSVVHVLDQIVQGDPASLHFLNHPADLCTNVEQRVTELLSILRTPHVTTSITVGAVLYLKQLLKHSLLMDDSSGVHNVGISSQTTSSIIDFVIQNIQQPSEASAHNHACFDIMVSLIQYGNSPCLWLMEQVRRSFDAIASQPDSIQAMASAGQWIRLLQHITQLLDQQRKSQGGKLSSIYHDQLLGSIAEFLCCPAYVSFLNMRLSESTIAGLVQSTFRTLTAICHHGIPPALISSWDDFLSYTLHLYGSFQSRLEANALKCCTSMVDFWTCLLSERSSELVPFYSAIFDALVFHCSAQYQQEGQVNGLMKPGLALHHAFVKFFYTVTLLPSGFTAWTQRYGDVWVETLWKLCFRALCLNTQDISLLVSTPEDFVALYPFELSKYRQYGRHVLQSFLLQASLQHQEYIWNQAMLCASGHDSQIEVCCTIVHIMWLVCPSLRDKMTPVLQQVVQNCLKVSPEPSPLVRIAGLSLLSLAAQFRFPNELLQEWRQYIPKNLGDIRRVPILLSLTTCKVIQSWLAGPYRSSLALQKMADGLVLTIFSNFIMHTLDFWHIPLFPETACQLLIHFGPNIQDVAAASYLQTILDLSPSLFHSSQSSPAFAYACLEFAKQCHEICTPQRRAYMRFPEALSGKFPDSSIPTWCIYTVMAFKVGRTPAEQMQLWQNALEATSWKHLLYSEHVDSDWDGSEKRKDLEARVHMIMTWIKHSTEEELIHLNGPPILNIMGVGQWLLAHQRTRHLGMSLMQCVIEQPIWSQWLHPNLGLVLQVLQQMVQSTPLRQKTHIVQFQLLFATLFETFGFQTLACVQHPPTFCQFVMQHILPTAQSLPMGAAQWLRWTRAFFTVIRDIGFVEYANRCCPDSRALYLHILERADWFMQQGKNTFFPQSTWKEACDADKLEAWINRWPHMILESSLKDDGVLIRYGITHCEPLHQRFYQRFQEMYTHQVEGNGMSE